MEHGGINMSDFKKASDETARSVLSGFQKIESGFVGGVGKTRCETKDAVPIRPAVTALAPPSHAAHSRTGNSPGGHAPHSFCPVSLH